jgi:hypothetical protein
VSTPSDGSQPSAFRPARRIILGLNAPTQIAIESAGRGPGRARPSSKRPPLRTSSVAAAFANTAGGRSDRLATSVKNEIRFVSARSVAISDHVSKKRCW